METTRKRSSILLLLALAAVAGCGGSEGVTTANVAGTVCLDGKPVEGVEVRFLTENHSGYAVTADDGTYRLVQGAEPGENKVYFQKMTGGAIDLDPETGIEPAMLQVMMEAQAMERGGRPNTRLPTEVIPSKYSDPAKSNITYQVPEGGTETADFQLTSK